MKKLIITVLIVLVSGMVLVLPVRAQEEQDSNAVIYEAFPQLMPVQMASAVEEQPRPVSLALKEAFQKGLNVHELRPILAEEIATADKESEERRGDIRPGPRRVGVVCKIAATPLSVKSAVQLDLSDGKKMWTLAIRSPESYGMRIHFSNFDVGDGLVLAYAQDGEQLIVRGPYRGKGPNSKGDFWTASLPGDTAFLEITGTEDPAFEIAEIVHFDQDFTCADCQGDVTALMLGCHLDVMCYGVSVGAREATGQMNYVRGGKSYVCTGTILNDLDDETWVPYFLTAYHCLSTQAEINTLEVVWFWQRDSCGGTLPNYFDLPRNTGGTLLETNPTDGGNDMTFIRLADDLPGGVGFAGWTTDRPVSGYGIHHPNGVPKRVTFLSDVGSCPGCTGCGDPADYDYYDMDSGIIEGGSSGSGVFNSSGQLAGQLYGICCPSLSCVGESLNCGNVDEFAAMYGEFETTYPIIRDWLKIGGTIHVDGTNIMSPWLGTPDDPFPLVSMANNFAWNGARIKIRAGSYPETLTFSKELTVVAQGGIVTIGQ
jgi:hypothetical protein